jgi:hypothetical protein
MTADTQKAESKDKAKQRRHRTCMDILLVERKEEEKKEKATRRSPGAAAAAFLKDESVGKTENELERHREE